LQCEISDSHGGDYEDQSLLGYKPYFYDTTEHYIPEGCTLLNAYNISVECLKGRDHSEDTDIDERIILKWILGNWNFRVCSEFIYEPGSSVSIVSGYGLDDRAIGVRSLAEEKGFFPLTSVSRPSLGPTQPPVQWVPGVLSPGVKRCRGVTLTTHPHLVARIKMSRSYTSSPCASISVL
jgi:hypothetical protein